MASLTTSQRNRLPASAFADPANRAYPVPDAPHADNAKARASQMHARGLMSAAKEARIDARANRVLARGRH